ncbi:hypothetical protein ACFYNO_30545 [Kitasatospora sp. NPDC006697]|uniref:hypothetical protein n=1 Tax=Kitasatospora sp. NPDC006697 TaxID=3364020 RepID=UPI0036883B2E
MTDLTALHVNWTGPFRAGLRRAREGGGRRVYGFPPEEVLSCVHSALAWREHHGPIELVTDELGAAWCREQGLAGLYERIDTGLDALDGMDLDPVVWFTGAKYLAVRDRPAPFVLLDTDLYLRRPLAGLDRGGAQRKGFWFAHWESVDNAVYPPPEELPNRAGADLSRWLFDTPATNMAIAAFLDEDHRAGFAQAALGFALGNGGPAPGEPVARPAFAEQRLAPAVARTLGVPLHPVAEGFWLVEEERWDGPAPVADFHHIWNLKAALRRHPELHGPYLRQLLAELLWRFPDTAGLLARIPALAGLRPLLAPTLAALEQHGPLTDPSWPFGERRTRRGNREDTRV